MKIKKVLIVDNNATIVELIRKRLVPLGYEVMEAYDGMQALELLEKAETLPDVIILDLVMPKIDGQRLTRILKLDTRFSDIPIVILSGIAAEEDGKILSFGADAHIAKGKIEDTFGHIRDTFRWLEERPHSSEQREEILGAQNLFPREMTKELLLVKKHFDSMLQIMEEGVVEIDQHGRILFTNAAACRLIGAEDHVLFGKDFQALFAEEGEIKTYLTNLSSRPAKPTEPVHLVLKEKIVRAVATPFYSEGKYVGAIVVLVDISSLVRRERALEDLMAAIVKHAPVGLCLLNDEGQVLVSNPAFNAILQEEQDWNPAGLDLREALSGKNPPLVDAVSEGLSLPPGQMLCHKADHVPAGKPSRLVFNVLTTALEIAEEKRFLLLLEDVTHETLLEENLRRINEELERASHSKSTFLSMVSHELRTPLSVIRGYISLILEGKIGREPGSIREALSVADKRGRQLQHLIEELLDLSRIETGKLSIKKENLVVKKHIKEVVEMFRDDQERKGLQVLVDIPDDLPEIAADHDKVHQIFTNLISNAIKFSEEGGMITVTGVHEDGHEMFEVRDSGIGIPKDKLVRIFDKFYQVDSTETRRHTGTGLGLSIVKMILEAMGGNIEVTSEVGRGSTFQVALPIGEPVEEGPKKAAPGTGRVRVKTEDAIGKKQVLVVEDDPDTRNIIRLLLPAERYVVIETSDAFQGLKEFFLRRPDIVLADALLPLMSGLELCRIIKTHPGKAKLPVIILSAAAQEDEIREGYEVGADEYLVKPFNSADLLESIKKLTS